MKNIIILFLLTTVAFTSCSPNLKLIDLSEFTLKSNALKKREKVVILACTENPEENISDYFIHMLVKSEETGDTVNVLFLGPREIYGEDVKSFISTDDIFYNHSITPKPDYKSIKKVYSNPEYMKIDWRKYPSIIGNVSTIYNNVPTEELIDNLLDDIKEKDGL